MSSEDPDCRAPSSSASSCLVMWQTHSSRRRREKIVLLLVYTNIKTITPLKVEQKMKSRIDSSSDKVETLTNH